MGLDGVNECHMVPDMDGPRYFLLCHLVRGRLSGVMLGMQAAGYNFHALHVHENHPLMSRHVKSLCGL